MAPTDDSMTEAAPEISAPEIHQEVHDLDGGSIMGAAVSSSGGLTNGSPAIAWNNLE